MRLRDDRRSTVIKAQERGLFLNITFPKKEKNIRNSKEPSQIPKNRLKFHFQFLFPLLALYMDKNKKKTV